MKIRSIGLSLFKKRGFYRCQNWRVKFLSTFCDNQAFLKEISKISAFRGTSHERNLKICGWTRTILCLFHVHNVSVHWVESPLLLTLTGMTLTSDCAMFGRKLPIKHDLPTTSDTIVLYASSIWGGNCWYWGVSGNNAVTMQEPEINYEVRIFFAFIRWKLKNVRSLGSIIFCRNFLTVP